MLLAMDIGNTNIKIGLYNKKELIVSWRISVKTQRTADEYYIVLLNLLNTHGFKVSDVDGIIISSVVPTLNYTLQHTFGYYFNLEPIMVCSNINTGLTYDYNNPEELGADRIANAVATHFIYHSPAIIVDLGTATTIGAINSKGCFLGGAISIGLKTSIDSLAENAARLQAIELSQPKSAIGKNTKHNMQSGAIYGFTGLVERMILEFKKEMAEENIKVIATGGLSELIVNKDIFDVVDRALTLKGLQIIYELNS